MKDRYFCASVLAQLSNRQRGLNCSVLNLCTAWITNKFRFRWFFSVHRTSPFNAGPFGAPTDNTCYKRKKLIFPSCRVLPSFTFKLKMNTKLNEKLIAMIRDKYPRYVIFPTPLGSHNRLLLSSKLYIHFVVFSLCFFNLCYLFPNTNSHWNTVI